MMPGTKKPRRFIDRPGQKPEQSTIVVGTLIALRETTGSLDGCYGTYFAIMIIAIAAATVRRVVEHYQALTEASA